ncbi:MAG TPA: R3H domain-containing nucleic acid-binding protein [Trueperaceae bacterium]|nr:R3H domain-containing nucleic acid-binding protein [Trueperaceae bacterium]
MDDRDLDRYLEDLGINMDEEDEQEALLPDAEEEESFDAPVVVPAAPLEGDARERCEAFLVDLLLNFDPSYAVEVDEQGENEIRAEIYGGDPGKIIGRAGRTLAALEFITNAVINRDEEDRVRVSIDVGGYKRRRDERLRGEARKAAARVRKTGHPVEMDAMSAAERRVVHMALADDPDIISESSGEGKDRHVVVKPTS